MYVIIDIETTGGNKKSGKITEVAAFKHDGSRIVDQFSTLVNPEIPIPPFITNLTGISNNMVADAPIFEEIADDLNRFTANAIFVAHNVNFDYGFIREAYRGLGREFSRKRLCTVKLSRVCFPGLPSYSLGKLTNQLNISLDGAHRAEADAKATVELFERIVKVQSAKGLFDANFGIDDIDKMSSPLIHKELLQSIPDDSGIYKFYNRNEELIYVKRSSEILSSICGKLKPNGSKMSNELIGEVHSIDWQITGSDLLAQLIEANEVVEHRPKYNNGKFSMKSHFGIFIDSEGSDTYLTLKKLRSGQSAAAVEVFSNFFQAVHFLKDISDKTGLELEEKDLGKFTRYRLFLNESAKTGVKELMNPGSFLLTDEARTASERAVVLMSEGTVRGYGFWDVEEPLMHFGEEHLDVLLNPKPELEMVVRHFLEKKKYDQLIKLSQ